MLTSVIVPAYNAAATLKRCVTALENQTASPRDYEIIVVDDGSTDETAKLAADLNIHLVSITHRGAAAARNHGAREARGEILLFTDADCEPSSNWIKEMLAPFVAPDVVGAKGIYRTRQHELIARFVQLEYEEKYARMARAPKIDFIDTYSAAYRRRVFIDHGGFDESFPTASVEDQEFSFRLAKHGLDLVYVPTAIVYHLHPTTFRAYFYRKLKIGYWKAHLHRRHPDKVWQDSHTPSLLKLQTVLFLGLASALVLVPFSPPALWLGALIAFSFCLTTIPLMLFVLRRDPAVALIAPELIGLRATGLGLGLVAGVLGEIETSLSLKRIVDVLGALVALILLAPLMLAISIAIKLDSPGPALFTQLRAGKDGIPFRILKFRSMVEGAERMLDSVIERSALPPPIFKIPNDPRVTRVGRFLRRFSLDEIPQFVNVLKGEMSLVGPRPEETRIVGLYNAWHRQRLVVKPGITGPAQAGLRGPLSLDERVRLELEYIEHRGIRRDLLLLFKTIPAIIKGDGSY